MSLDNILYILFLYLIIASLHIISVLYGTQGTTTYCAKQEKQNLGYKEEIHMWS